MYHTRVGGDGLRRETKEQDKMKKLMLAAVLAAMASGCVMMDDEFRYGPLTVDVGVPDTHFVDNSVQPLKKGVAKAHGVICFVEGDSSIKAAMENGGITKVHHVDHMVRNILGLVGSRTTIVWGE